MSFLFPRHDPPIESVRDLYDYFERGAKGASEQLIGVEMESLPVRRDASAVPADGPGSLDATLEAMARRPGYEATRDAGRVVLLRTRGRSVGMEPGGQLELSGAPHKLLADVEREIAEHLDHVSQATPEGIHWLALGEHPVAALDEIPWVPKERYRILAAYLGHRGALSHHMMKKTATVQASFDYESLSDAVAKLRTALLVTPVIVALSANSPYAEGRSTGYLSHRTAIWEATDPSRSGRFARALDRSFDIEAYVSHVLDLPLVFFRRGGRWRDGGGLTFRHLLSRGIDGERATLFDWELHLSSFFPDVRLKQVVEVRGADCPPRRLMIPLVAFLASVLYDASARDSVEQVLGGMTPEEHGSLQHEAAIHGLRAPAGGRTLRDLASDLLGAARRGLAARRAIVGVDESDRLDPLQELLERGTSPAADLLREFGETITDPVALVSRVAVVPPRD